MDMIIALGIGFVVGVGFGILIGILINFKIK